MQASCVRVGSSRIRGSIHQERGKTEQCWWVFGAMSGISERIQLWLSCTPCPYCLSSHWCLSFSRDITVAPGRSA